MKSIGKILALCEAVLVTVAIAATAVMMLLTSADALFRYAFNSPILGAYEITEKYLIVAAIFLGLSYAYRGGVFIRVTFLVDRLPPVRKAAANHLSHGLSLLYCAIFIVATFQQAFRSLSDDTTMTVLPILTGPSYMLVPIGFFAMFVLMLADLPRVRKGTALLFSQEAPES
jgi:TRAP-type C4-dicarboxylate transport system permease small subunit